MVGVIATWSVPHVEHMIAMWGFVLLRWDDWRSLTYLMDLIVDWFIDLWLVGALFTCTSHILNALVASTVVLWHVSRSSYYCCCCVLYLFCLLCDRCVPLCFHVESALRTLRNKFFTLLHTVSLHYIEFCLSAIVEVSLSHATASISCWMCCSREFCSRH